MGRTFKPKTERKRVSSKVMEEAVKRVFSGHSIRATAKELNISKSSLQRQISEAKKVGKDSFQYKPNTSNRRIFTLKEEKVLAEYLIKVSKMNYGLSATQTRELAYSYGKAMHKIIPKTWENNSRAGIDWLRGFMGRNPLLSLKTPEASSLSRATAINKHIISENQISNCDEIGLVKPPKVIAACGTKQDVVNNV